MTIIVRNNRNESTVHLADRMERLLGRTKCPSLWGHRRGQVSWVGEDFKNVTEKPRTPTVLRPVFICDPVHQARAHA